MNNLFRNSLMFARNAFIPKLIRPITTTQRLNIKEIREEKQGSSLIIEGVTLPPVSPELLIKPKLTESSAKKCYMCSLGLNVKHTDVLILSQFVRSDGCMLPRRITGLCKMQQKKLATMVTMAQKAGLMINLTPDRCKKDPKRRKDWKKFNTYFDESTIFVKRLPKQEDRFRRSGSMYID